MCIKMCKCEPDDHQDGCLYVQCCHLPNHPFCLKRHLRTNVKKVIKWLTKETSEAVKFGWEIQRRQALTEVLEKLEPLIGDDD